MDLILRNHQDLTGNVGLEEYEQSLWEGLLEVVSVCKSF